MPWGRNIRWSKIPTCSTPGSAPPSGRTRRSAGRRQTPELALLLPDQRAGDEPRHHHALGGAHGDHRAVQLRQVPFHHVYIHPKILDGFGETMSKSKGNGIDPLDIIERYGTDALRFGMVHLATETQDSRMPVANVCPHCDTLVPVKQEHMYMRTRQGDVPELQEAVPARRSLAGADPELPTAKQASERFEMGRNFANKLWNAARFLLLNLEGYTPAALRAGGAADRGSLDPEPAGDDDGGGDGALEGYHFSEAARTIYDFTWSEFCDWYMEMSKGRLRDAARPAAGAARAGRRARRHPAAGAADHAVRGRVDLAGAERGRVRARPAGAGAGRRERGDRPLAGVPGGVAGRRRWRRASARMQELVRGVREVRNRYTVDPKTPLDVFVRCSDAVADGLPDADAVHHARWPASAGWSAARTRPSRKQAATHVTPEFEAYVSLAGLIDAAAEIERLEKQLAEKRKHLQGRAGQAGQQQLRGEGAGRGGAAAARPRRGHAKADAGDRGELARTARCVRYRLAATRSGALASALRCASRLTSVFAEIEFLGRLAAERVAQETLAARRAQVVSQAA